MEKNEISKEKINELIARARNARNWAYAPYSGYPVGAALLTGSGKIYDGVNVENAALPCGTCAERVAVFKAVSEGEREFLAIVISSGNGAFPCGACRQVLSEFGLDIRVVITSDNGEFLRECELSDLLPEAFGPEKLIGTGSGS